ncbi:SMC family ATPase [Ligilactobacillus sp. WILCCON 0076]|uniref:Nuclease SbcCD subunit C n=1 Tax=Ligilactobacillus ubinensis TaxID=2876789 RepID=A0A9X2JM88_9LACO|nr:SMC family ATPase [Ligilactobacillus ubinensis]MCP0887654.1 SMC family ATPase [Ligilactobacillus ubinensis]
MKPMKLHMQNFGPYVDETVDFMDFYASPLFLISGKTGSGKTTIFDGMCYALYGKTSVEVGARSGEEMRSKFAPETEPTLIEFIFEHNGVIYTVSRKMKVTRGGNLKNEKPDLIYKTDDNKQEVITGITAVNKKIEELLGLDVKQFKQVILLPQGEFANFLSANANKKSELLERFFDTEIYKRIEEKLIFKSKMLAEKIQQKNNYITKERQSFTFENELTNMEWLDAVYCEIESKNTLKSQLKQQEKKLEEMKDTLTEQKIRQETIQADYRKLKEFQKEKEELKEKTPEITKKQERLKQLLWAQNNQENWLIMTQNKKRKNELEQKILKNQQLILECKQQQESLELKKPKITIIIQANEDYTQRKKTLLEILPFYATATEQKLKLQETENKMNKKQITLQRYEQKMMQVENKVAELKKELVKYDDLDELQEELLLSKNDLKELLQKNKQLSQLIKEVQENQLKLDSLIKEELATKQRVIERQEIYAKLDDEYTRTQIIRLTKKLKPGQPCPVCGAVEHPAIALKEDLKETDLAKLDKNLAISKEQLEREKQLYNQLVGKIDVQRQKLQQIKGKYQSEISDFLSSYALTDETQINKFIQAKKNKNAEFEEKFVVKKETSTKMNNQVSDLNNNLEEYRKQAETLKQVVTELNQVRIKQQVNFENTVTRLDSHFSDEIKIKAEISRLSEQQTKNKAQIEEYQNLVNEVSRKQAVARDNITSSTTEKKQVEKEIEVSLDKLEIACKQADFSASLELLAELRKHLSEIEIVRSNIMEYEQQAKFVEETLLDLKQRLENVQIQDLAEIGEKLSEITQSLVEKRQQLGQQEIELSALQKSATNIATELKKNDELTKKYEQLITLTEPIQGKGQGKLDLQRFVLQQHFQKIIVIANQIMKNLTLDRYVFQINTDSQVGSGTKAGLLLDVIDKTTGEKRSTETLSGGESFIASLSLALAMAETIQNENGGISIDALFIDEGFGSLDADYLSRAIEYLQTNEDENKMVGIISHVTELKSSIPDRLQVANQDGKSKIAYIHE